MTSKWAWWLSQIVRRIWFRATLFSILAVLTALLAIFISPWIPARLPGQIGADAVDKILGIIATSMLTVTTFSLNTMVSAYTAASSNVTPRATRLVMEDSTTQNVLATFLGSFLFSLVGIIMLTTGAYGEQGRLVLFVVTIGVVILIVVTLLRWIDHLSRLGRVTETTERVERAAIAAVNTVKASPCLGGHPLTAPDRWTVAPNAPVFSDTIGYVQHVDAAALSRIADRHEIEIAVFALAGTLVSPDEPLAYTSGPVDEDCQNAITSAFTIGDTRSFDQDPRFGASVLTEIASRALSPAVNDPGTAIDVISRAMRILAAWNAPMEKEADEVLHPRLHVMSIALDDLFDDLFTPIARDGAGLVEVALRLQKAFCALARFDGPGFYDNACRHAAEALARAEMDLTIDADKQRLRKAAADVGR
ncbi:DUF2254 domain-containing protein [Allorhizobium sp. BGMRC 0089]|uniref:DUF2254 domain-containing protein n=1 Tax=Allorhizobium sonneratiae TaxID=2934936 RepID=UPI002033E1DF|nr:DUF2254 domain-containing protein [Allorhizobium sonneratiae]MCM2294025.1 DUF2254 domain-containing protein [Allorhizobium sonneratiae]